MSKMKGMGAPGAPQAIGLTPSNGARPPQAGSAGELLVKTSDSMPASSACCTTHADMPKWLLRRHATMPSPYTRAMSTAAAMARCATTAPKALWPSTCATTGVVCATVGCARGSRTPWRTRAT